MERDGGGQILVLSRHFSAGTDETHEKHHLG
jgi:hypothetical protein